MYQLRDIFTVGLSGLPAVAPSPLLEAGTLSAQGASKYEVLSYIFV